MKVFALVVVCCLTACVSQHPAAHEVGRREAARLRISYARWLAIQPRKIGAMEVPLSALSREAREAGFRDGSVDSQIVMLSTAENEGLIFGIPSTSEIEGLKDVGFILEPTPERDVFKFRRSLPKA